MSDNLIYPDILPDIITATLPPHYRHITAIATHNLHASAEEDFRLIYGDF